MKRRNKRLAAVGMAAVMAAGLMTGCGTKATPENLLRDMSKNAESVESFLCNVDMKAEMTDGTSTLGISVNMDMESLREPESSHAKGRMDINMDGTSLGQDVESYQVTEGDEITSYTLMEGVWSKSTESDSSVDNMLDIDESLADSFQLAEDLVDVNGQECFELQGTISGELFNEAFAGMEEDLFSSIGGMELDEAAIAETEIPCTIDIYKESILPAKVHIDMADVASVLMGDAAAGVTFSEYYLDMTFMEYDSVEEIVVPDEALAAAEDSGTGAADIIDEIDGSSGGNSGGDVTTAAEPAQQSGELGATWDTYTVQINDKVLTLPCTMADLEAAGVTLDTEYTPADYMVNAGEYELAWFVDANGNEVMADMLNTGTEAIQLKDCVVGGISVDAYSVEDGSLTVIFPGGIQIGSTPEQVIAAYGEAHDFYEGDYIDMYSWYGDGSYFNGCEIDVDAETGVVSSMYMDHFE